VLRVYYTQGRDVTNQELTSPREQSEAMWRMAVQWRCQPVSSPLRLPGLLPWYLDPSSLDHDAHRLPQIANMKVPDSGLRSSIFSFFALFLKSMSFSQHPLFPCVPVCWTYYILSDLAIRASPANSNRSSPLPPNIKPAQPLTARHFAHEPYLPVVARSQEQYGALRLQNSRHHACDRLPGLLRPAT